MTGWQGPWVPHAQARPTKETALGSKPFKANFHHTVHRIKSKGNDITIQTSSQNGPLIISMSTTYNERRSKHRKLKAAQLPQMCIDFRWQVPHLTNCHTFGNAYAFLDCAGCAQPAQKVCNLFYGFCWQASFSNLLSLVMRRDGTKSHCSKHQRILVDRLSSCEQLQDGFLLHSTCQLANLL